MQESTNTTSRTLTYELVLFCFFAASGYGGYLRAKTEIGYSPIGFVRCGRSACRIAKMNWKIGKETGGKKMEEPHSLKSNEMAEVHAGWLEILPVLRFILI